MMFKWRSVLVVVSIVMMVASASVSYYKVRENSDEISNKMHDIQAMDEQIRGLWDDAGRAERNADAAVVVSLLAQSPSPENTLLRNYYMARVIGKPEEGAGNSIANLLTFAKEARDRAITQINDIYLKRTNMEDEIRMRESENMRYAAIAFFLQLLSVVLVVLTREMPEN